MSSDTSLDPKGPDGQDPISLDPQGIPILKEVVAVETSYLPTLDDDTQPSAGLSPADSPAEPGHGERLQAELDAIIEQAVSTATAQFAEQLTETLQTALERLLAQSLDSSNRPSPASGDPSDPTD